MELNIKFFGKTKELEPSGSLVLNFADNISVGELRTVLIKKLSETSDPEMVAALINDCAIGNAEQILRNEHLLAANENLVLLPPVCGG